jgi:zinc protease
VPPFRRPAAALAAAVLLLAGAAWTPAGAQSPTPAEPPVRAAPAGERAGVFFPETFTLSNGMQVVAVVNDRVPVVSHMVMYKVGSADEPRGKSGIAHYLEHLMFKGTETREPGEFSRIVAREGGRDNAFTSWDYTGYFQIVAADRLRTVMELEADRMANLSLTPEVAIPELSVVREERRQRTDVNPSARLGEQISATLFVHHPYGTPIIGWDEEIRGLTLDDAIAFYREWYAPNNAVLVVSGDVDVERLRTWAEETYGRIPSRPVPERVRVLEPRLEAERRVVLRDAEVRQASWQRYWMAPSYNRGETRFAYPLQVLGEILGGETGRLYRELVVERRIASSAGFWYSPTAFDMSTAAAFATPAAGVDPQAVEAAVEEVVAGLLRDGVTEAEVARAKQRLRYDAIYARDSVFGPARTFGVALATGQRVEDVEAWPARIAAVTAADVDEAARAVLGAPGHVTGVLLPAAGVRGAAAAPSAPPRTSAGAAQGAIR